MSTPPLQPAVHDRLVAAITDVIRPYSARPGARAKTFAAAVHVRWWRHNGTTDDATAHMLTALYGIALNARQLMDAEGALRKFEGENFALAPRLVEPFRAWAAAQPMSHADRKQEQRERDHTAALLQAMRDAGDGYKQDPDTARANAALLKAQGRTGAAPGDFISVDDLPDGVVWPDQITRFNCPKCHAHLDVLCMPDGGSHPERCDRAVSEIFGPSRSDGGEARRELGRAKELGKLAARHSEEAKQQRARWRATSYPRGGDEREMRAREKFWELAWFDDYYDEDDPQLAWFDSHYEDEDLPVRIWVPRPALHLRRPWDRSTRNHAVRARNYEQLVDDQPWKGRDSAGGRRFQFVSWESLFESGQPSLSDPFGADENRSGLSWAQVTNSETDAGGLEPKRKRKVRATHKDARAPRGYESCKVAWVDSGSLPRGRWHLKGLGRDKSTTLIDRVAQEPAGNIGSVDELHFGRPRLPPYKPRQEYGPSERAPARFCACSRCKAVRAWVPAPLPRSGPDMAGAPVDFRAICETVRQRIHKEQHDLIRGMAVEQKKTTRVLPPLPAGMPDGLIADLFCLPWREPEQLAAAA